MLGVDTWSWWILVLGFIKIEGDIIVNGISIIDPEENITWSLNVPN